MKKFAVLLFALLLILNPLHAKALITADDLQCGSAVLMEVSSQRILFDKNGSEAHFPASTTKIMTMLLACEKGKMSDELSASYDAVMSIEYGSSHISLQPDEKITLEDALYATSLASANDCANVIAEYLGGGDIEAFVTMMNDRAAEIGCENTHFANPHGLHDEEHYTCAADLARILSTASQNKQYITITSALEHVIPPTNKTEQSRELYTYNRCMDPEDKENYIPEIVSGKSGYTDEAGSTFVAYAKKDDAEFVVALMDGPDSDAIIHDLKLLFNSAFQDYMLYEDVNTLVNTPTIKHGFFYAGGSTVLESDFEAPAMLKGQEKNLKVEYDIDADAAQLPKGEKCGTAKLYYNNTLLQTRPLLVKTPVRSAFKIITTFLLRAVIALVIIVVVGAVGLVVAKKVYTVYMNRKIRNRKHNNK